MPRPKGLRASHNLILREEITASSLPAMTMPGPRRRLYTDQMLIKLKLDRYYSMYPHTRMLVWRRLWRASSPGMAMKAKQILKAGVLIDKKYAVIQRTVFLWFTVIPPADDRTPEQEAAYTEYVTYISEKGWSKYNALKALEARLQVGSEGDPGHEVLGGEEWEEDHDGDPSLGGDVGDDELS